MRVKTKAHTAVSPDGCSGTGKTTVARVVADLLKAPSSGKLHVRKSCRCAHADPCACACACAYADACTQEARRHRYARVCTRTHARACARRYRRCRCRSRSGRKDGSRAWPQLEARGRGGAGARPQRTAPLEPAPGGGAGPPAHRPPRGSRPLRPRGGLQRPDRAQDQGPSPVDPGEMGVGLRVCRVHAHTMGAHLAISGHVGASRGMMSERPVLPSHQTLGTLIPIQRGNRHRRTPPHIGTHRLFGAARQAIVESALGGVLFVDEARGTRRVSSDPLRQAAQSSSTAT